MRSLLSGCFLKLPTNPKLCLHWVTERVGVNDPDDLEQGIAW